MAIIHFIDGEKGGTGKSWVTRTMHHIFEEMAHPFVGVDSDMSNPTYSNIYIQGVQKIPFSLEPELSDLADTIFQHAIDSDVLVSLPAQVHRPLLHWLKSKDVANIAQSSGITIKKWWISDGGDDSIHLFLQSLAECDPLIQHIFVQNKGMCKYWQYFTSHPRLQQAIRDYQVPVVLFPELGVNRRDIINANRLTFSDALTYLQFGILGQAQVRCYLDEARSAISHGGAFGEPTADALALAKTPMPKALLAQLAEEKAKKAEAQKAKAEAETSGMVEPPIVNDGAPELVTAGGQADSAVKGGRKNGRTS